ncbi:hypothetical protein H9P43_003498 [Blastocladiella emersonii ATCC 22665]|nr:hypothetical protein H9P43_003498 [Blastocladiella emersonii ATCC 22665]
MYRAPAAANPFAGPAATTTATAARAPAWSYGTSAMPTGPAAPITSAVPVAKAAAKPARSGFARTAGALLNRDLLVFASATLWLLIHLARSTLAVFQPNSGVIPPTFYSPLSWLSTTSVWLFAVVPLVLWKRHSYRARPSPPPRPSWMLLALTENDAVASFFAYWLSSFVVVHTLTSGFAGLWTLRDASGALNPNFVDVHLALVLGVVFFQAPRLVMNAGGKMPEFPSTSERGILWFLSALLTIGQRVVHRAPFVALFVCTSWAAVHTVATPFLQSAGSLLLPRTAPYAWTWTAVLAHLASPVVVLALVLIQLVLHTLWVAVDVVCDGFATTNFVVAAKSNAELVEGLLLADKPLLQHHAFLELTTTVANDKDRRLTVYREQPDVATWSKICDASLRAIDEFAACLDEFVSPITFAAAQPLEVSASDAAASSYVGAASGVADREMADFDKLIKPAPPANKWISAAGTVYDGYLVPFGQCVASIVHSATPAPAGDAPVPTGPVVPPRPGFTWATEPAATSTVSVAAPVAIVKPKETESRSITSMIPSSLFPRLSRWLPTRLAAHCGHFHAAVRMTALTSDYQVAMWAAVSVAQLAVHSKVEDPYGLVYPDLARILTSLLRVIELTAPVMAATPAWTWRRDLVDALPAAYAEAWVHVEKAGWSSAAVQNALLTSSTVREFALQKRDADDLAHRRVRRVLLVHDAAVAAVTGIHARFPGYLARTVLPQLADKERARAREVLRLDR